MHTLMVVMGGLALLEVFLLFGQLSSGTAPALGTAAKVFIPVWLIASIVNLWIGLSNAG